jgi:hypothetical protein
MRTCKGLFQFQTLLDFLNLPPKTKLTRNGDKVSSCFRPSRTVSVSGRRQLCKVYYLRLYSPCGSWPLSQYLNLHTVGRTPWTGDRTVTRPLPTHRTTQTQNKRTQTPLPRVGFEPTILVFEQVKTVHALNLATIVIGCEVCYGTL